MDKMRRRNPRKFRKDMQWDYLRMYPVTRKKLWICKAAEDNIDIADFIDLLVTEYIVRRGLQAAVAKVISNAEAAAQTRDKWERELREKWEKEKEKAMNHLPTTDDDDEKFEPTEEQVRSHAEIQDEFSRKEDELEKEDDDD